MRYFLVIPLFLFLSGVLILKTTGLRLLRLEQFQSIKVGGRTYLKSGFQDGVVEECGRLDYLLVRVQRRRFSRLTDGAVGDDAKGGGFEFSLSHLH